VRRRDVIWALGGSLTAITPFLVRAQQASLTLGIVSLASSTTTSFSDRFLRPLKDFGWEDGRNCRVLFR